MRGLRADEASVLQRILSWTPCYSEGFDMVDHQALVDLKANGRIIPFDCPFEDCQRPARRHFRVTEAGKCALALFGCT
jgi:hypothetical protein